MRVCFILPGFCADRSDWHIPALTSLVAALAEQVEVVIYTLDHPFRRSTYLLHGATVHCLANGEQSGIRRFVHWAELRTRIARDHAVSPFSIIHGIGSPEQAFLATRIARDLEVPSVISPFTHEPATQRERFSGRFGPLRKLMTRLALERATVITAASSWRARRFERRFHHKLATIPLGVDTELFAEGPLRTGRELLAASSLSRTNDYPTILRAFALVRRRFADVRLEIAGMIFRREATGLEPLIEQLGIRDAVRFLGPVPFPSMPATYRRHDLLVHGAIEEHEGMAVIEALATGMPVVSTNVGIAPSLPPDIVTTVEPGDADAMAAAIIDSLSSDRHALAAHEEGPRHVRRHLSARRAAANFVVLYRALLPSSLGPYANLPEFIASRAEDLRGSRPDDEDDPDGFLPRNAGPARTSA
jgi:glycosyltransferase involved in cell wall biosynthesis